MTFLVPIRTVFVITKKSMDFYISERKNSRISFLDVEEDLSHITQSLCNLSKSLNLLSLTLSHTFMHVCEFISCLSIYAAIFFNFFFALILNHFNRLNMITRIEPHFTDELSMKKLFYYYQKEQNRTFHVQKFFSQFLCKVWIRFF